MNWLAALEATPLASWIREGLWPFPLINTVHILGIALLFGGIAVLDARLLGLGSMSVHDLARAALPVSGLGFAIAFSAGALMFVANAREYAANPYLPWKLGLIALAGANAVLLHATVWRGRATWGQRAPFAARVAGAASLGLWSGVILTGRLMAYF